MGYKYAHWRWRNALMLSVILMMPLVTCAMEQEEKVESKGGLRRAHRNIVNYLTKKAHNIDAVDMYGHTALMKASESGNKEVVDRLIKSGADINVGGEYGYTALIWASYSGYKEVVDSLIKGGAHINAVDNDGYTALIWVSFKDHKEVVNSLIKGGANINAVDNRGSTALILASNYGYEEIVNSLIKGGAHINAVCNDGWTALKFAFCYGHKEVVDSLIKGGANPYIKNKAGKNSLDVAGDFTGNKEELKKHIIKKRKEYVIKKYKEYLIDGKNRMDDLAVSLQKGYDWYKPYWDEDKGNRDEQEVKQSYPFPNDIAGVIAQFAHGISDDEWKQMRRLKNEQQSSQ